MSIFEKNPKKTITAFLLISTLLLDVSFANVKKFYSKYCLKKNNHEKEYRVKSTLYHHDLKPNMSIPKTVFGNLVYPVYTNSLGFRDDGTKKIPLKSDNHRVLFIGDSFTEGVGVPYENTFVGILEDSYSKRFEILNAGISSYSPFIYYRKVKFLIEEKRVFFDELFVCLDISDVSNDSLWYMNDRNGNVVSNPEYDVWKDSYGSEFSRKKKKERCLRAKIERILRRDTLLAYWLFRTVNRYFWVMPILDDFYEVNSDMGAWPYDDDLFQSYAKKGIQRMKANMEKLYELCKKNNIKMSMSVHPWPDQIARNDLNCIHVQIWEKWCQERQVDFYNLFPYFINDHLDPRGALDTYYIKGDIHWNRAGHQIAANALMRIRAENYKNTIDAE
jgi:hypothetical protein